MNFTYATRAKVEMVDLNRSDARLTKFLLISVEHASFSRSCSWICQNSNAYKNKIKLSKPKAHELSMFQWYF